MAARVARTVFRLGAAALILLLAFRTYEETAVAFARSNGTLRTAEATIAELTSHTTCGHDSDSATQYTTCGTTYTIALRVGGERKAVDGVRRSSAAGFKEGQPVEAGLWDGRLVEIDGRYVWPGWSVEGKDLVILVAYPLTLGYAIAWTMAATAYVNGRVRLKEQDRLGYWGFGMLVAWATVILLLLLALGGHFYPYWPLIPLGAGTAAALAGQSGAVKEARASRVAPGTR
ncbi:hypothetical protein ACIBVL_39850 [Streptomyces sp. NPDC049687]|uniref:hypothetical protein n=1 Tax=Streptomyces sp. NPDC049687 TaxID=3365596 RepID=UPI0037B40FF6